MKVGELKALLTERFEDDVVVCIWVDSKVDDDGRGFFVGEVNYEEVAGSEMGCFITAGDPLPPI